MDTRQDPRAQHVIRLRLDEAAAAALANDSELLDGLNRCLEEQSAHPVRVGVDGEDLVVPVAVLDDVRLCMALAGDQRLRQLSLMLYSAAVAAGWLS